VSQTHWGVSGHARTPNPCGVSGHCPTPKPEKCPGFNVVVFGAVIASKLSQTITDQDKQAEWEIHAPGKGRVNVPLGLPIFAPQSTYNAFFSTGCRAFVRGESTEIGPVLLESAPS